MDTCQHQARLCDRRNGNDNVTKNLIGRMEKNKRAVGAVVLFILRAIKELEQGRRQRQRQRQRQRPGQRQRQRQRRRQKTII